jgi:hypothetical protein
MEKPRDAGLFFPSSSVQSGFAPPASRSGEAHAPMNNMSYLLDIL